MFPTLAALPALVFLGLILTAAVEDALSFTIPNWISLALLAAFPLAALTVGMPLASAAMNLGVGAAALAAGMGMFALRWVGGGDAKLLAAVCLWLGLPALGLFLLATALAGGALAILLLTLRSDQLRPLILLGPPLDLQARRSRRERALRRGDRHRRAGGFPADPVRCRSRVLGCQHERRDP